MVNNVVKGVKGDPRVTAYKAQAERYCQKMGEDPANVIKVQHPVLANAATLVPYWYTVAERMFDLAVLLRSMAEIEKERQPKPANDGGPSKDGGGDASVDA